MGPSEKMRSSPIQQSSSSDRSGIHAGEFRFSETRLMAAAPLRTPILDERFGPRRMHHFSRRLPNESMQVGKIMTVVQHCAFFLWRQRVGSLSEKFHGKRLTILAESSGSCFPLSLKRHVHCIVKWVKHRVDKLITFTKLKPKIPREL